MCCFIKTRTVSVFMFVNLTLHELHQSIIGKVKQCVVDALIVNLLFVSCHQSCHTVKFVVKTYEDCVWHDIPCFGKAVSVVSVLACVCVVQLISQLLVHLYFVHFPISATHGE